MERLLELARTLRAACPWERALTLLSYRHAVVESAQGVALALETGDAPGLKDQLGDALFSLAFLLTLAEEQGALSYGEVEDAALAKSVRRHPQIFGDGSATGEQAAGPVVSTPEEAAAAFAHATACAREARDSEAAALCEVGAWGPDGTAPRSPGA